MLIYVGGKIIPLDAEDVMPFAAEICAVWDVVKPKTLNKTQIR
jgi:hypothetical protein